MRIDSNNSRPFTCVRENLGAGNEMYAVHRISSDRGLERCAVRFASIRITEVHIQVRYILNNDGIVAISQLADSA